MADVKTVAAAIKSKLTNDDGRDLEFLAQLFEDMSISDTGAGNAVQNRLQTILEASSDGSNNGVTHFAGIYAGCQDTGFREAFKDPWPSSRNQVGHFTTAVDMGFRPSQTYMAIRETIRNTFAAGSPALPVEERVCIGLVIGHEQVSDDALMANWRAGASATSAEILKFFTALSTINRSPNWDVGTSRQALNGISIGDGVGNSIQDLHLSLYGFGLGKFIRKGEITSLDVVARWIRTDLGGNLSDVVPTSNGTASA
jgi:hypothetical protein